MYTKTPSSLCIGSYFAATAIISKKPTCCYTLN